MGIKISDMDADAAVGGGELIPVSDDAVAKSVTIDNIKDYIIDQIEASTVLGAVDGNDFLIVLENGDTLKEVDIDLVKQYVIDAIWAAAEDVAPDDADLLALLDGGTTEKTVTLANLAAYVLATIEAALINLTDVADGSGAMATTDYMLVTRGGVGYRIQISDIITLVYAALVAHVNGLGAAGAVADGDLFYTLQSGVAKKVTLAEIIAHAGIVVDGSGTADYLAQWVDADTLKAGPTMGVAVDGFAAGSDAVLPTTALVRGEMDEIINDATAMGAAIVDADTFLIDDGAAGTQRKSTMARVYTYTVESIIPPEVDGTLATGPNDDFVPTKLVYAKQCADTDIDDIIDLHDGTVLGQIVSIHLAAPSAGGDDAVITPVTALNYTTITLSSVPDIATLQWQGAVVGWAILYTDGAVALA